MSRHYLFAMWEGGGNVPPTLGVARRLIARGHTVTVIGDPTIGEEAERRGCRFTPWKRAPHRTTLRPEHDLLRDWETKNPFAMLRNYRDRFIVGPAPQYAADTLEAMDTYAPDVVVPEYTMFGATMAAQAGGLPVAALVPNIWPIPTPGAPPFGPGFMPATSWIGRARDAIVRRVVLSIFADGLPSLNQTRKSLGLEPLAAFFDQVTGADVILVLSSAAFDFSSPSVPANVRYVGPVLDDPDFATAPWTPPWPAENRDPIVLVGFSSTFQDQAAVLDRVVRALSGIPVRGLVTLGEMLEEGAVKSEGAVAVVRSAPHNLVLKQASLLITHCGHGTTLKGLAAGVPLLCMPMGRDQDDTAARVVHSGAGLRLPPSASAEKISRAVARLLEEERYRSSASRLAEAIRKEANDDTAVVELERIPGAEKLRLGARSASFSRPGSSPPEAARRD